MATFKGTAKADKNNGTKENDTLSGFRHAQWRVG